MNKQKLKTIGLALGLCFAVVGAGVAVSASSFQGAAVEAKAAGTAATITAMTNGSGVTVNGKSGKKLGTNKAAGDITFKVGAGATKLSFYAAAWNDVNDLSLNLTGATAGQTSFALTADSAISGSFSSVNLSGNEGSYLFETSLSGIETDTAIKLTPSAAKRFVIWNITYEVTSASVVTGITTVGEDESGWLTIDGNNAVTAKDAELLYQVEYDGDAGAGEITTSVTLFGLGTDKLLVSDDGNGTLTLTAKANNNYKLDLTTKDKDSDGNFVTKTVWVKVINLVEPILPAKISDVGSLSIGDKIYFVYEDGGKVAGPLGSNTYLSSVDCALGDGNKMTSYDGAQEFVLGRSGAAYTLSVDGKLLGVTSKSNTKLALGNDSAANTWNISFTAGGASVIVTPTVDGYGSLQFNSAAPRFTNYTSSQASICMYALQATPAEVAAEFEANYLFMDEEVEDQCKTYYANAKSTFQTLSDEQIAEISQDALDRLAAWAKANGETFDPTEHTFKAAVNNAMPSAKTSTIVVLAAVFGVTAALAGSLLFFRKRKEN